MTRARKLSIKTPGRVGLGAGRAAIESDLAPTQGGLIAPGPIRGPDSQPAATHRRATRSSSADFGGNNMSSTSRPDQRLSPPARRLGFAALLVGAALAVSATAMAAPCGGQAGVSHINDRGTPKQQRGGFVAHGAFVDEHAYVGPKAQVCDSASVESGARIYGNARVGGEAIVTGTARVYGNAVVEGNAVVQGKAKVSGNARISGDAIIAGSAIVRGYARLSSGVVDSGVHAPAESRAERTAREKREASAAAAAAAARNQQERRREQERLTRELASVLSGGSFNLPLRKVNVRPGRAYGEVEQVWSEIEQKVSGVYEAPCRLRVSISYLDNHWQRYGYTSRVQRKTQLVGGGRKDQKGVLDFATQVDRVMPASGFKSGEDAIWITLKQPVVDEVRHVAGDSPRNDRRSKTQYLWMRAPYTPIEDIRRAGKLAEQLLSACRA